MMIVLALLLFLVKATIEQDCIVDTLVLGTITNYPYREPVLLNPENLYYIYPEKKDHDALYISVPEGTSILVSCGHSSFYNFDSAADGKTFVATCTPNADQAFHAENNHLVNMESLSCLGDEELATVVEHKSCAEGKGMIIQIGFPISSKNTTVPLYEVCFDFVARNLLYMQYFIAEVQQYRRRFLGGVYPEDDDEQFYNLQIPVSDIYNSRQKIINTLLGLPENSDKYFQNHLEDVEFYEIDLVQEMLAYYQNFFYAPQQIAASRLFNSVPLWHIKRNSDDSNWNHIKYELVSVAADKQVNLVIYAGTYGVATLPHEKTKEDVELYLNPDPSIRAMPVPKLLWQLLYHPEQQKAVVLVAVNNPFVVKNDDVVCEDVFTKYRWDKALRMKNHQSQDLGLVYACTYEDFKTVVTFLPELEVKGVLSTSDRLRFSVFITCLSCLVLLKFV